MLGLIHDILGGDPRLRDPRVLALAAVAGLVALVLAIHWRSWCRSWDGQDR
jgi:hypothetical protein